MPTRILRIAVLAAAIAATAARGRMRRYAIAERSMQPTLEPGDYVIAVAVRRPLMRGDVVILRHPERRDFEIVKRIVGLAGETVTIAEGRIHIDGAVLPEPWATGPTHPAGAWQLRSHEVFILGDERKVSASDSRFIGPVQLAAVGWVVAVRYWPPQRIGVV